MRENFNDWNYIKFKQQKTVKLMIMPWKIKKIKNDGRLYDSYYLRDRYQYEINMEIVLELKYENS